MFEFEILCIADRDVWLRKGVGEEMGLGVIWQP